ncbi:hypothetical protein HY639_02500 [Candidatus Woesearchaeota archaeon]|nr:hypothetical protein [Candidatus Woesearchaeota archaeon]
MTGIFTRKVEFIETTCTKCGKPYKGTKGDELFRTRLCKECWFKHKIAQQQATEQAVREQIKKRK